MLVADDNADMREYLQPGCSRPRYAVRACADGRAALEAALADPPDLVVSDVMMPRLDGMQLLAALRADERTARVPVLLLSARAGQEAAVEGLAAGADDYLVKPFSAQELLARVGAHLHLGRARREAEERFTAMADLAPALIWVADPRRPAGVRQPRAGRTFTGRPGRRRARPTAGGRGCTPRTGTRYRRGRRAAAAAAARAGRWSSGCGAATAPTTGCSSGRCRSARATSFAGYVGSCTDINARYRETERQTLLAAVGAALDRETAVGEQLTGAGPPARRHAGWPRSAPSAWSATTGGCGSPASPAPTPATEAGPRRPGPGRRGIGAGRAGRRLGRSWRCLPAAHPASPPARSPPTTRVGVRSPDGGAADRPRPGARRPRAGPRAATRRRTTRTTATLVEEIAARAALAVDNALLLAEERAAARRLALLQRATAELLRGDHAGRGGRRGRQPHAPADRARRPGGGLRARPVAPGAVRADHRRWPPPADERLVGPSRCTRPARRDRRGDTSAAPCGSRTSPTRPGPQGGAPAEQADGAARVRAGRHRRAAAGGRRAGWSASSASGSPPSRGSRPPSASMLLAVAEQCAQALDRARLYRAEQRHRRDPAAQPAARSSCRTFDRLALAAQYLPGRGGHLRPAVTGTTSSSSTARGSRSRSATSSVRGPRRRP